MPSCLMSKTTHVKSEGSLMDLVFDEKKGHFIVQKPIVKSFLNICADTEPILSG